MSLSYIFRLSFLNNDTGILFPQYTRTSHATRTHLTPTTQRYCILYCWIHSQFREGYNKDYNKAQNHLDQVSRVYKYICAGSVESY